MPIDPIDLISLLAEMKRRAQEDIEEESEEEESIEETPTEETPVRAAPAVPLLRRVERAVAERAHENAPIASPTTAALKNNQPEITPAAASSLENAPSLGGQTLADMLRNPRILPYAVVVGEILGPPMAERDPLQRWPLT